MMSGSYDGFESETRQKKSLVCQSQATVMIVAKLQASPDLFFLATPTGIFDDLFANSASKMSQGVQMVCDVSIRRSSYNAASVHVWRALMTGWLRCGAWHIQMSPRGKPTSDVEIIDLRRRRRSVFHIYPSNAHFSSVLTQPSWQRTPGNGPV